VRYVLKDYQVAAANEIVKTLRRAGRDHAEDPTDFWSVALSAPTGAGKTVIASAVIETLFDGGGSFAEDPLATVLWVTDDPALNEQTKRNMMQASSTLGPSRLTTIDSGFDEESSVRLRVLPQHPEACAHKPAVTQQLRPAYALALGDHLKHNPR